MDFTTKELDALSAKSNLKKATYQIKVRDGVVLQCDWVSTPDGYTVQLWSNGEMVDAIKSTDTPSFTASVRVLKKSIE